MAQHDVCGKGLVTMSKQYHYVVVFDEESGRFDLDYDTMSAVFPNGTVYETDSNEWSAVADADLYDDESVYNKAGDAIASVLFSFIDYVEDATDA